MTDAPTEYTPPTGADEKPRHALEGTQIANPLRATVRTVVQALVTLIPLGNVAAGIVLGYLNEQTDVAVPGWVFAIVNGVLVATGLIIGLVTRLMANPGVNAWVVRTLPWLAPIKPVA